MEILSLIEAQQSLEKLLQCPGLRCVLDSFSSDLSKKTREDIYALLKDGAPAKVLKPCSAKELPKIIKAGETCFVVRLKSPGDIQILWRNEAGKWKLSNAAKRPYKEEP